MNGQEILPHLFRTEYRKIISVLVRYFGFEDIGIAEDITSEVFLIAAETWGLKGLPDNPEGWLHTVAKRKALDVIKRRKTFRQKVWPAIGKSQATSISPEFDIDISEENIRDSQLLMMFVLADPVISAESRIALILQILCGFGVEEIASAFLTNAETIRKRLYRGKEKLKEIDIKNHFIETGDLSERADLVLAALYLLFNEGYYSTTSDRIIKKDLCFEAMRLNLLLIENEKTNKPSAAALLALMCFHASRFDARMDEQGEMIRYDKQNTSLWNQELIQRGNHFLNLASRGEQLTSYHIEAAIAYWHTTTGRDDEKWNQILQLYNQLLILKYTTVAALNRTYALSKVMGKKSALHEAMALGLKGNYLYHALLGYLYTGYDDQSAVIEMKIALGLAKTEAEQKIISADIDLIQQKITS